jgi:hypothetical protein
MHALLLLALVILQSPPAPNSTQVPPGERDDAAIHREMEQLILQVEVHQRAIDRMLYEASTGHKAVQSTDGANAGALVQKAYEQSRDDQRDMQLILDLAASHTHKGNGT